VNWAADWVAPGRILHGGHGALVLGELDGRMSDRVQGLAKLLAVVAPTEVSDNVLGYTWAKHVYGALLVATAVVDAHVYEVVERSPEVQQMLVDLVVENMRTAEAAGIRLEPFDEYAPADYRAAGAAIPRPVSGRWRSSRSTIASTPRPRPESGAIWRCAGARRKSARCSAPRSPGPERSASTCR
jgi:2-dehydropantoate 2-reductase